MSKSYKAIFFQPNASEPVHDLVNGIPIYLTVSSSIYIFTYVVANILSSVSILYLSEIFWFFFFICIDQPCKLYTMVWASTELHMIFCS